MTGQKKLKQLVRARMAATAESYTTARRHVLAHSVGSAAVAIPTGVLPGYRTFGQLQHHDSGLVANVLDAMGHPYTEAMLNGLGGGIGFMYAVFEYRELPPLMTIVAQHHPQPWVPATLDRLGIRYRDEHSTKLAPALRRLRTAVTAGTAVFVTVDRSRLPWHGLEPGPGHDGYLVVVAGVERDSVYIDDLGRVPHELPVDDFGAAWSAFRKGRHHGITIEDATPGVELPVAIRDAIATTVAHLTGPVLGHSFDTNFGFSGMAKLVAQLRDTRTKQGWAKRFGAPLPFFHGVRRLYECIEVQYTSPGATRPVYAQFLDEAAPLVDDRLTGAAELFRQSGRLWSRLAMLALDTSRALGTYADLAEEQLALIMSGSPQIVADMRAMNLRVDALAAEYGAADPLGDSGRRDLFAAMADIVESCQRLEEEAVGLLSGVARPRS